MTTEATEDRITTVWTYMGRRRLAKGGLGDFWIDDQGTQRAFKKFSATVVGGRYDVVSTPDREAVIGNPRWRHGDDLDGERDPRAKEWALEDRAAYTEELAAKAERRAAKEDAMGDLTLRDLHDKLLLAHGGARTALLAQILRYLGA